MNCARRRIGGEPLERRRQRLAHPFGPRRPAPCRRRGRVASRSSMSIRWAASTQSAFVVEEFVEGLAADARLVEDVGDRGRLVALGAVTRTTAASRRSRWERRPARAEGRGGRAAAASLRRSSALVGHRLGERSVPSAFGAGGPARAPPRGPRRALPRGRRAPGSSVGERSALPAAIWLKISTWARPKASRGSMCGAGARPARSQSACQRRDQQPR